VQEKCKFLKCDQSVKLIVRACVVLCTPALPFMSQVNFDKHFFDRKCCTVVVLYTGSVVHRFSCTQVVLYNVVLYTGRVVRR
jgi:hypothetical protein